MGQTAGELRREIAARRAEVSRDLDAIGDRVSPKQAIGRRREAVRGRINGMRDAVMGSAESAGSSMGDAAGSAKGAVTQGGQRLAETPEMAKRQVEGNPLAAGLIAFGAGLLLASLLPPSRREQELTRHAEGGLQKAAGELRDAGQQVAGELREQAQGAAQQVREVAGEAASQITDQAKESAGKVADQTKGSAQHVADEVKEGSTETRTPRPGAF